VNIQIKHRLTAAVLFEGEFGSLRLAVEAAVESRANLTGAYLAGAYLMRANLTGAYLTGANLTGAYLMRANLTGANLTRANLTDANLAGAYLTGANLAGAYLTDAYLMRANLTRAYVIDAGQDLRGYRFVGWLREGAVQICAGCRNFTLPEAREHWQAAHANNLPLRAECLAKLDLVEAVAKSRGWIA
jgi:uncharacterized protein YjbI with pentapeptide repeats